MALLRDLWMPSSQCYITGPVWPTIEAENFEMKPGLIAFVQQQQFGGLPTEDPYEHLYRVMEYSGTVKYHGVPQDAIKCMLFSFSLRDDARAWYRSLPSRSFGWNEISRAFLDKYFPLHKQSAIRDEIFNFVQREGESLNDAWEIYKALFRRCPNHGLERWLELQIFYRGLTSNTRAYVDMAAGGAITNKTLDEAFLLIESIAFHQLQWYNKKPTSDSLVCLQQITTPQPLILTQKPEPLSQCDKIELAWIIFNDDDTILVDTHATDHMDTSVGDSVLHCDDSSMDEPELQLVVFDIEELPLVHIDQVLLDPDMEKFTFDDVSRIASSTLEPEMESFMVEYGEVDSDVKEPSSTISLVDTSPVEISTTTPHLVSSIEVVLKLLPNYLRYTYMIGYSIDDLEGILSVTCIGLVGECSFRLMLVYHLLRVN
ncbi:uncharacterized protein LOC119337818 isoform X2 [Triticum dicoccoides]|uniref:uncharacterized protein LOC119337818 isoform X2 n=1 Tax=Triticum dicoccoides TaxID=85692 RepID=UPI001891E6AE|nr:uncharacterized protein LOC119337818 isoform X2 [Triticum dicoccoides]